MNSALLLVEVWSAYHGSQSNSDDNEQVAGPSLFTSIVHNDPPKPKTSFCALQLCRSHIDTVDLVRWLDIDHVFAALAIALGPQFRRFQEGAN